MATSDLIAQIAAMQQQLAALIAAASAAAAAPAPPPAPAPVAAPVARAAVASSFIDADGVEWIAEGIRRWNGPVDQLTLKPPVPLAPGGHRGWWNSGDPYVYQQRDGAFLTRENQRIQREWLAQQPPPPPPKVYPPGSLG